MMFKNGLLVSISCSERRFTWGAPFIVVAEPLFSVINWSVEEGQAVTGAIRGSFAFQALFCCCCCAPYPYGWYSWYAIVYTRQIPTTIYIHACVAQIVQRFRSPCATPRVRTAHTSEGLSPPVLARNVS